MGAASSVYAACLQLTMRLPKQAHRQPLAVRAIRQAHHLLVARDVLHLHRGVGVDDAQVVAVGDGQVATAGAAARDRGEQDEERGSGRCLPAILRDRGR
jgi:hypothetical protein